ncbi:MAG: hypothetical protein E7192_03085 [Erysipelotrichaceae bacterium]|nr:hypothetical protein [Erysipelotrichaceae bacterium]
MRKFTLLAFFLTVFVGCHFSKSPIERTIVIHESSQTKGILCDPGSSGTAVLLVGGSGPVDLDYTVEGVSLYAELAESLKESSIASLRLEKGEGFPFKTIHEEWLEDIVYGLNYLKKRYERVILLGHSLSAIILPVFEDEADGLILLAGAVSEVEEVYAQQLMKSADEHEKKQIQNELDIILSLEEDHGFSWLGIPESWWISLDQLHLKERLESMEKPVLVLAAGKDEQINEDEYHAYQIILGYHPDAEFEIVENVNHFFIDEKKNHLDESFKEKVVSWILKQSSGIMKERGAGNEKSNFNCGR